MSIQNKVFAEIKQIVEEFATKNNIEVQRVTQKLKEILDGASQGKTGEIFSEQYEIMASVLNRLENQKSMER